MISVSNRRRQMTDHHLILGELSDFLTAETLPDTHDERYRQRLARLLVEEKGYLRQEIEPRRQLVLEAGRKRARIPIDLVVRLSVRSTERACMIVKYGPGSLVSRHRPALSMSRLIEPYQIPVVVVSNGEDADVLEGATGKPLGKGLDGIPGRQKLQELSGDHDFAAVSTERAAIESRIAFAFEIECSCSPEEKICSQ